MGTPDIARKCLQRLHEDGHDIVGVYTKQDTPKNRGMKLVASPVKELALSRGIPVYQPEKLKNNAEALQIIKDLAPDLVPIGYADDGLIEAVYMPSKNFVFGVQWHPEFHFDQDPISQQLFKGFLDACRATKSYVNTEEFIENN